MEGVLKARGCMLLMLSPLSQVTWATEKSRELVQLATFNPHPRKTRLAQLDQLSFCERRWAGGGVVVESSVRHYHKQILEETPGKYELAASPVPMLKPFELVPNKALKAEKD